MNNSYKKAYIAFGANLPFGQMSPGQTVTSALDRLNGGPVRVLRRSSYWQSPAWPDPTQPPYINGCAALETSLPPYALLRRLMRVERHFGRHRGVRNAPRTLDLDLILYDDMCLHTPRLTLPHKRARDRAFVLVPLYEIAPNLRWPRGHKPLRYLVKALADEDKAALYRKNT